MTLTFVLHGLAMSSFFRLKFNENPLGVEEIRSGHEM